MGADDFDIIYFYQIFGVNPFQNVILTICGIFQPMKDSSTSIKGFIHPNDYYASRYVLFIKGGFYELRTRGFSQDATP
ncbi:hypothetical protein AYI69_g4685 [Smittium culicis]|uniref:Uncharacterized protein n=1 Tax=Smittium culicis TaxID=133412 RepID=A0A1R1YBL4_9FUNG|nr:hypothetical protein AYI69_g4685 [Smittium culicis]